MPMRATTLLLASLIALDAPNGRAQNWRPDSATILRLNWGPVNVLLQADTVNGLLVWAETSPVAYEGSQQSFAASFSPDSLDSWVNFANLLVTTTTRPKDSAAALATPPLFARDSSHVYLLRRQKKGKWESRVEILLSDRAGQHPWRIEADRDNARAFVQALWLQGGRSHQRPPTLVVHDANPLDPFSCPQLVPGTLVLRYPELLQRRGEVGEVWMSYVVQRDGTPDTTSFQVMLSDEPEFAIAAIEALRRARFQPAEVKGVPVATWVHQRFYFRFR
jgi:TonB family protein